MSHILLFSHPLRHSLFSLLFRSCFRFSMSVSLLSSPSRSQLPEASGLENSSDTPLSASRRPSPASSHLCLLCLLAVSRLLCLSRRSPLRGPPSRRPCFCPRRQIRLRCRWRFCGVLSRALRLFLGSHAAASSHRVLAVVLSAAASVTWRPPGCGRQRRGDEREGREVEKRGERWGRRCCVC